MATWSFTGFDWARFRSIAPELRRAVVLGDLTKARIGEAADLIAAFEPGTPDETICNAVVSEMCARGSTVTFDGSLPECLRRLRKHPQGEEAAEVLAEAAFAQRGCEEWMRSPVGVMGILTWAETEHLASHLAAYRRDTPAEPPSGGILGWARRLAPIESDDDLLAELASLVDECVAKRLGLAAVME